MRKEVPFRYRLAINNMAKLKTVKSITKRIKVTKNKKFLVTPAGQSHFRSRHSGSSKMHKRKYKTVAAVERKNIHKMHPYALY